MTSRNWSTFVSVLVLPLCWRQAVAPGTMGFPWHFGFSRGQPVRPGLRGRPGVLAFRLRRRIIRRGGLLRWPEQLHRFPRFQLCRQHRSKSPDDHIVSVALRHGVVGPRLEQEQFRAPDPSPDPGATQRTPQGNPAVIPTSQVRSLERPANLPQPRLTRSPSVSFTAPVWGSSINPFLASRTPSSSRGIR